MKKLAPKGVGRADQHHGQDKPSHNAAYKSAHCVYDMGYPKQGLHWQSLDVDKVLLMRKRHAVRTGLSPASLEQAQNPVFEDAEEQRDGIQGLDWLVRRARILDAARDVAPEFGDHAAHEVLHQA